MEIRSKQQIDSIIEDHLFDLDHENETPYEFIAEVCYRFFNLNDSHSFITQNHIEEYVLSRLRDLLDTDYDLNIFRLRFAPLNWKQKFDL